MAKKSRKSEISKSLDKYTLPSSQKTEEAENINPVDENTATDTFWTGKGKLWIGIVLFCLVLAIISGAFILNSFISKQNNQINTTVVQEAPSPSPQSAELDRSTLRVEILNGGGVTGSAASAKSFLENLGYKGITVGNADSYDFKNTLVETKESKKNYEETLIKDLSAKYKASASPTFLDETNDFDVIITIGAL